MTGYLMSLKNTITLQCSKQHTNVVNLYLLDTSNTEIMFYPDNFPFYLTQVRLLWQPQKTPKIVFQTRKDNLPFPQRIYQDQRRHFHGAFPAQNKKEGKHNLT